MSDGERPAPASAPWAGRAARALARTLLALFFRRVEVTGTDQLPDGRGGLLIAWHPNGLVDPALVLASFPGRVVFGARHGLFRWPLLGAVLRSTAVPIYRRQDRSAAGDEAAAQRGNEASLAALAATVGAGAYAMLFPEGDSHDQPGPIELRTGAARLLVSAVEAGASPAVVPVGLHYDRKRFFRSRALVVFHAPLDLDAELGALAAPAGTGANEDGRREVARRLTARFAAALDHTSLATADWEEHHLMHRLRRLLRAERAARAQASPGPSDMRERRLGFERVWSAFRALRDSQPAAVEALRARLRDYDRRLRRLGFDDHELDRGAHAIHGRMLAALVFQRLVVDALIPPLALVGLVVNLPAALVVEAVARAGARRKKDVASLKLLVGAVLFPAAWIAAGVLAARGQGWLAELYPTLPRLPWLTGLLAVAVSAAGGALVLAYGRLSRRWGRALWVAARRRLAHREVAALRGERAAIFADATRMSELLDLPGRVEADGRVGAG